MSSISSFERHLPENLYTAFNEANLFDGKKHELNNNDKFEAGSIKIVCKKEGTEKERVVIKLKGYSKTKDAIVTLSFFYQDKSPIALKKITKAHIPKELKENIGFPFEDLLLNIPNTLKQEQA